MRVASIWNEEAETEEWYMSIRLDSNEYVDVKLCEDGFVYILYSGAYTNYDKNGIDRDVTKGEYDCIIDFAIGEFKKRGIIK